MTRRVSSTWVSSGRSCSGPRTSARLNEDRELTSIRVTGYVYKLPPRFIFWGKGFGHGVGMSQWGAQGMALNGANYEQILKHYYRGIALTNIGGA